MQLFMMLKAIQSKIITHLGRIVFWMNLSLPSAINCGMIIKA